MRRQFAGDPKGDRVSDPSAQAPRLPVKRDECLPPVAAGEVPPMIPKRRPPRKAK